MNWGTLFHFADQYVVDFAEYFADASQGDAGECGLFSTLLKTALMQVQ